MAGRAPVGAEPGPNPGSCWQSIQRGQGSCWEPPAPPARSPRSWSAWVPAAARSRGPCCDVPAAAPVPPRLRLYPSCVCRAGSRGWGLRGASGAGGAAVWGLLGGALSLSRAPKASGRGRAPWGQGQSLSCHWQGHGWRTPGPRVCVMWGAGAGCWGASAPLIPGGQGWVPRGVPRHLPPPLPGC